MLYFDELAVPSDVLNQYVEFCVICGWLTCAAGLTIVLEKRINLHLCCCCSMPFYSVLQHFSSALCISFFWKIVQLVIRLILHLHQLCSRAVVLVWIFMTRCCFQCFDSQCWMLFTTKVKVYDSLCWTFTCTMRTPGSRNRNTKAFACVYDGMLTSPDNGM